MTSNKSEIGKRFKLKMNRRELYLPSKINSMLHSKAKKIALIFILSMQSLVIQSQTTLFFDDCNSLGNWTNTGRIYPANQTGYDWLSVDPIVPSDDHTGGGNCFYTNGNADYLEANVSNYILYQIVSNPINLSGYTDTRLEFWMQYRGETGNWDGTYLEWSHDGANWTQFQNSDLCLPYDGNMSNNPASTPYYPNLWPAWSVARTTWTRVLINTSAIDNVPQFYLRVTFHSDELANGPGVALDDFKMVSIARLQLEGNTLVIPGNNTPLVADNTDFGISPVGVFVDKEFFIHNSGESPLTLTGTPAVTVTGSSFSVIQQPSPTVIPPGDSVSFKIRFLPVTAGTFNGTIVMPNSDIYSSCNLANQINITGSSPNTPPIISGLQDTMVCPGATQQQIAFTLSDLEQVPSLITVSGTSSNQLAIPNSNLIFSGSGSNRILTFSAIAGQTGIVSIIITANDGQNNSNTSSDTVLITLGDTEPPTALCKNTQIQLDLTGNGTLTTALVDSNSTDNCLLASLALSQTQFTCVDVGINSLFLIATDGVGNVSQCPFIATVLPPAGSLALESPVYANGKQVSCFGLSDGTINALAQGGCSPYTYEWQEIPGFSGDTATDLPAGVYTVKVTDAAGQEWIEQITLEQPPLIPGTYVTQEICEGESTILVADSTALTTSWNTSEQSTAITVSDTGLYTVIVTIPSETCARQDSFHVVLKICFEPLLMVNAFSPNSDGVNDVFKAKQTFKYDEFNLLIYNRWGLKVFESENPFFEWDGKSSGGNELSSGTYFYVAKYAHKDKSDLQKASVTLIR
jgi:gliding motility-associated-like protein